MAEGDKLPDWWRPANLARQTLAQGPDATLATWEDLQYAEADQDSQAQKLLEYWRVLWKHKWIMMGIVASALAVGLVVTLLTRPIYTATTTLEIDRQTPNVAGLQDVQPVEEFAEDQEFFQTQYGLLKSRSLAERIAQSLGLGGNDAFFKVMHVRPKPTPAAREAQAVSIVQRAVGVLPERDSRLVQVTFDSPSPGLSATLANAVGENFIQANLERRFQASGYARQFLEEHLADVKTKLEDSERKMVAYAVQQQIIKLGDETGGAQSGAPPAPVQSLNELTLSGLDLGLTQADANLAQVEQRYRAAAGAAELASPDVLADATVQSLRQERAKLSEQYTQQLKLFKPDYPDMQQLKAQIADIDTQLKGAADVIRDALRTQYRAALQQRNALQGQVSGLKNQVLDDRNREIEYTILQREVDTNRSLYDGLLQRYKDIGVAGGVTANNVSIVDRALPPAKPSKPQPLLNLAVAGGIGLVLAALSAFLLEALDQAIRRPGDIETKLGLPLLGSVPLLDKGVQPMEALADIRSPFSEAYHAIRGILGFTTNEGVPRVLAITSARPEEGKSTCAMALAQGFARLGQRVLIVDLDLRNPSLHKLTGADNRKGASTYLSGGAPLDDIIQQTEWANLYLIPSGPLPPSAAELLSGQRINALVRQASEQFDLVVIDSPPVMGLADAPLIASVANGAIVTVEAGRTGRGQALSAIRRLRMANVRILGVILTKFDARTASYGYGYSYSYAYDYDYDYGREKTPDRRRGPASLLPNQNGRKRPPAA